MKLRQQILDQIVMAQVKVLEDNNKTLSYNPIENEPPFSRLICDHFIYMAQDTPVFATTKCQSLYPFIFKNDSVQPYYEKLIGKTFDSKERISSLDSRQIMNLLNAYQKIVATVLLDEKTWNNFISQNEATRIEYFKKQYESLYDVQIKNILQATHSYDSINKSMSQYFNTIDLALDFLDNLPHKMHVLEVLNNILESDRTIMKSFQPGFSSTTEFSSNFNNVMQQYESDKKQVVKVKTIIEKLCYTPYEVIANHLHKMQDIEENMSEKIYKSLQQLIVLIDKRSKIKII